ncbi:MAG: hypothetical protein KDA41_07450 [Planctomycetales bacterium]|nr:hypothetical protein [Planctomycetales bacterium]
MSEHDARSPELNDVAAMLAGLRPQAAALDRDRIFFAAGQAAAVGRPTRSRAAVWGWPLATAALVVLCATFAFSWRQERGARVALENRQTPPPSEQVAPPPESEPAAVLADIAPAIEAPIGEYLVLRRQVLLHGADALPDATAAAPAAADVWQAKPGAWREAAEGT